MTAPIEETCHSLEGIARYIRSHENSETPTRRPRSPPKFSAFISKGHSSARRAAACIRRSRIAKPSVEILEKFLNAADGLVRMVTLAPEIPGAMRIDRSTPSRPRSSWRMGHTDADYDQARAAIQAGARHAVHMYNAMRPFTHRDPGVIGAILTDPEVTAEVIADGVHVAGPAIQVLLGAKGFDTVLLVSDGIAATGMPDGNYRLGNFEVTVKDGVCRNAEGKLAGSTLTLDRALRNVVALGVPLRGCRAHGHGASRAPAGPCGKEGHHRRRRGCRSRGADARSATSPA